MGEISTIQWTQATWNPWHGCKKISPGCKYCYMYRDKEMHKQDPTLVVRGKTTFNAPLKWKEPRLIFTCSWSDWFIDEADQWRSEAWAIIKATPWHTYQILTKRIDRVLNCLPPDWGAGYPNVWLGVSVESQDEVWRIDLLGKIPAAKHFISFEPLIGELTEQFIDSVDWIIIGGESGNETGKYRYRPMQLEWARSIIDGYRTVSVLNDSPTAIFVKQLGTYQAKELGLKDHHGGDMSEWPRDLQIREMPKVVDNLE